VTIVGLQAVGLILMVALLVIPAAAARFWTHALWKMFLISGVLGAAGGLTGAAISALFSKLPSGAMIVLVCASFFLFSLIFGTARGVLIRAWRRFRLNREVDRQHLLRELYELLETSKRLPVGEQVGDASVQFSELLSGRSWSPSRLQRAISRARREDLVEWSGSTVRLTEQGMAEAIRLTRQHRLWELYLITHADIAPSRVDRDADAIEHVLEPELIDELESLLARESEGLPVSPHDLSAPSTAVGAAGRSGAG
jgi:manganese/zinc/iron transport system permease protein